MAVRPAGDTLAATLGKVAPRAPQPAEPAERADAPPGDDARLGATGVRHRTAARGEAARRHDDGVENVEGKDGGAPPAPPLVDAAPKGTISVPASAVTRALAKHDVSARDAVDDAGKPLGARLVGVGKYGVGLHDGDVVVFVAGTRTPTVQAMVSAAMAAAQGGAKHLRGKVLRGDAIYSVVLELPEAPQ
jgi:hypothetical protein